MASEVPPEDRTYLIGLILTHHDGRLGTASLFKTFDEPLGINDSSKIRWAVGENFPDHRALSIMSVQLWPPRRCGG